MQSKRSLANQVERGIDSAALGWLALAAAANLADPRSRQSAQIRNLKQFERLEIV